MTKIKLFLTLIILTVSFQTFSLGQTKKTQSKKGTVGIAAPQKTSAGNNQTTPKPKRKTTTNTVADWGVWKPMSCFSGILARVNFGSPSKTTGGAEGTGFMIEFKNTYSRKVSFMWDAFADREEISGYFELQSGGGEQSSIALAPGATRTYSGSVNKAGVTEAFIIISRLSYDDARNKYAACDSGSLCLFCEANNNFKCPNFDKNELTNKQNDSTKVGVKDSSSNPKDTKNEGESAKYSVSCNSAMKRFDLIDNETSNSEFAEDQIASWLRLRGAAQDLMDKCPEVPISKKKYPLEVIELTNSQLDKIALSYTYFKWRDPKNAEEFRKSRKPKEDSNKKAETTADEVKQKIVELLKTHSVPNNFVWNNEGTEVMISDLQITGNEKAIFIKYKQEVVINRNTYSFVEITLPWEYFYGSEDPNYYWKRFIQEFDILNQYDRGSIVAIKMFDIYRNGEVSYQHLYGCPFIKKNQDYKNPEFTQQAEILFKQLGQLMNKK